MNIIIIIIIIIIEKRVSLWAVSSAIWYDKRFRCLEQPLP